MTGVSRLNSEYTTSAAASAAQDIAAIAAYDHREAARLAQVELERFIALAETLDAEDWARPTACTLWNVQQIVAHQADHCYWGLGGLAGLVRHLFSADLAPYRKQGMSQLDASNQYAVDSRAGRTPAELIAEMRERGPHAVRGRDALSWAARRLFPVPVPLVSVVSLGYLIDVILPRDMWMHRLDICRATGRAMTYSADHDGRIIALIMRDLGRGLLPKLRGRAVTFDLSGAAGGRWRAGPDLPAAATIHMDALDFCVLNSARMTAREALDLPGTSISGDQGFGRFVLDNSLVLY